MYSSSQILICRENYTITLKLKTIATPKIKSNMNNLLNFYNTKRPHSLLRYRTPDVYESECLSKHKDSELIEAGQ